MLSELDEMYSSAQKANDTLSWICAVEWRGIGYDLLGKTDSVKCSLLKAYEEYSNNGYQEMAINCLPVLIDHYVTKGNYVQAKKYRDIYEENSICFQEKKISEGKEIYYYYLGNYYTGIHLLDSAELCYRAALATKSKDAKEAALKGLYELFKRQDRIDSVAKYADLCYQFSEDRFKESSAEELCHMHSLYNYTRNQTIAAQKSKEAAESKSIIWMCLVIIFVLVFTLYLYVKHIRKRREKEYLQYQHNLELLDQYKTDVENLEAEKNTVSDRLSSVIDDAQEEIAQLEVRISNYEKRTATKARGALVQQIRETGVYQRLRKIADQPTAIPSLQDWQELRQVFDRIVPNFYATLYSGDYLPNETEYHLCMLIWLQFSPSDISNLIAMSNAYVSVARKKLLKNIFKTDGSAKEFDIKIREIT
jgi:hypothetical protein